MAVDKNDACYRRGRIKHINPDGSPTSRVFKPREKDDGKLSVDIKSLTTSKISVKDTAEFNLFETAVSNIENIFNIEGKPLQIEEAPTLNNPAHALIVRVEIDDDITPMLLARASVRVIP